MYGKESEVMIEELLRLGRVSVSRIILRAYTRLAPEKEEVDKALIQRYVSHIVNYKSKGARLNQIAPLYISSIGPKNDKNWFESYLKKFGYRGSPPIMATGQITEKYLTTGTDFYIAFFFLGGGGGVNASARRLETSWQPTIEFESSEDTNLFTLN